VGGEERTRHSYVVVLVRGQADIVADSLWARNIPVGIYMRALANATR
jgi:hypothetical protein